MMVLGVLAYSVVVGGAVGAGVAAVLWRVANGEWPPWR